MLFNSLAFLVFFPVVTALYFAVPQRSQWLLLLVASCLFYMAFIPAYILILAFTILIDYFAGILIAAATGKWRALYLGASLCANVGMLAVFKYWDFVVGALGPLATLLGVRPSFRHLGLILPIGLSFHTFQAMSYTIEVYRGAQAPERHLGVYALYVMFYPQLVAGPIERPQHLLPQLRAGHSFDYACVVGGLKRMALGMFKKVVLADGLAVPVNDVFGHLPEHHGLSLIVAIVFFAFQIYYDFSGYSDIAIGSAQVMGINLMTNFATPYFSSTMSEFWRRWHISLSTWFRDYVYIPLGGNRVGGVRRAVNLFVVFLVSGLWHGANWTFVVWGALHGLYFVIGLVTQPLRRRLGFGRGGPWGALGVFALTTFAWIFFRAPTVRDAFYVVRHLFVGLPSDLHRLVTARQIAGLTWDHVAWGMVGIAAMTMIEWLDARRGLFDLIGRLPVVVRFGLYYALVYLCFYCALERGAQQQFIYFQF